MKRNDEQEYTWTVGDLVSLRERLAKMDGLQDQTAKEVKEINNKLDGILENLQKSSHVVVDNTSNSKDKLSVIAVIVVSAVFMVIYTLNQLGLLK